MGLRAVERCLEWDRGGDVLSNSHTTDIESPQQSTKSG